MLLLLACVKTQPQPPAAEDQPVVEAVEALQPVADEDLPHDGLRPDLSDLDPLKEGDPVPEVGSGPLVLALWASWCPPCRKELPHLQELQEAGVPILAASVDLPTGRDKAVALHSQISPELKSAYAPELALALRTVAIPALYVYDSQGQLVWYAEETFTEDELDRALVRSGVRRR
jgi:thiol-disulfide isomerase/thioredoxin